MYTGGVPGWTTAGVFCAGMIFGRMISAWWTIVCRCKTTGGGQVHAVSAVSSVSTRG